MSSITKKKVALVLTTALFLATWTVHSSGAVLVLLLLAGAVAVWGLFAMDDL